MFSIAVGPLYKYILEKYHLLMKVEFPDQKQSEKKKLLICGAVKEQCSLAKPRKASQRG